jgi:hypothetical protein
MAQVASPGVLRHHLLCGKASSMELGSIARGLIGFGLLLVALGALLLVAQRLGLGRLPGDIVVKRPGFTFYAPLATSILLSVVLTLLLNLWSRKP